MSSPVALITGTSSGIGLASAVAAAGHGFTTVATMRDTSKHGALQAAAKEAGVELDIRYLDVTDPTSVVACIDGVVADHGALDVLVNNAGRGFVGTIEQVSMEQMRDVMEVNYFGVVATTKAAMPHLRASKGRVVTVTSVGGVVGQPFNEAYCSAKFAVEGFMESLAPVAATVGVHVSVVEPGPVTTEFVNNVGVDVGKIFAEAGEYEPAMQGYFDHVMAEFADPAAVQTAERVAEVVLTAMVTDSPAFRHQTSHWSRTFTGYKLSDHDGSAVVGMTSDWVRGH
ncbi:MAG: SDR family NAD(P)-dependent oxidoreductase [Acidimicrobiales bacterium]|jgi:NAD(P)-dependent dehydrogenase (short-subunit alcohol dehydrogenase family)